jgi:hypothetical protein
MGYEMNSRGSIPGREKVSSPLHKVLAGSGAHPDFYARDMGLFSWG